MAVVVAVVSARLGALCSSLARRSPPRTEQARTCSRVPHSDQSPALGARGTALQDGASVRRGGILRDHIVRISTGQPVCGAWLRLQTEVESEEKEVTQCRPRTRSLLHQVIVLLV